MKNQLLALTAIMAFCMANSLFAQGGEAPTNYTVDKIPTSPISNPNKPLDIEKIIRDIFKQKPVPGPQKGVSDQPYIDALDKIEKSIKSASLIKLQNAQIAIVRLKSLHTIAVQQLENILAGIPSVNNIVRLTSNDVDKLITLLTWLYNGQTYAGIKRGQGLGFDEGIVGKTFKFISDAGDFIEQAHSWVKSDLLLTDIPAQIGVGGVITPTEPSKKQQFISYALGQLIIYKYNLQIPVNTPREQNPTQTTPALPLYPVNS